MSPIGRELRGHVSGGSGIPSSRFPSDSPDINKVSLGRERPEHGSLYNIQVKNTPPTPPPSSLPLCFTNATLQ